MHQSMPCLVCICKDDKGTKDLMVDDVILSWEHNVNWMDILQFNMFLVTLFRKFMTEGITQEKLPCFIELY
jgi:hypothetical protein